MLFFLRMLFLKKYGDTVFKPLSTGMCMPLPGSPISTNLSMNTDISPRSHHPRGRLTLPILNRWTSWRNATQHLKGSLPLEVGPCCPSGFHLRHFVHTAHLGVYDHRHLGKVLVANVFGGARVASASCRSCRRTKGRRAPRSKLNIVVSALPPVDSLTPTKFGVTRADDAFAARKGS